MNIWNEPFPSSIEELIIKCDTKIILINQLLNDPNCKRLKELYQKNEKTNQIEKLPEVFEKLGYCPNTKLKKEAKANNEIQGLYVFGEVLNDIVIPRYVGISRTIYRRLRQHGWGKLHNEATFAYLKAVHRTAHKESRKLLPYTTFEFDQSEIRNYKIAIIPELSFYDLYFMEVYIAGKLKTVWNSFKTH